MNDNDEKLKPENNEEQTPNNETPNNETPNNETSNNETPNNETDNSSKTGENDSYKKPQNKTEELTGEEKFTKCNEQLLRCLAEIQNTKKRNDTEIAEVRKFGAGILARDLLSVSDNLAMALKSISDEDKKNIPALKNLAFGLDMISNDFIATFEKNNIKKILPNVGDAFDHNLHQAMGEVEVEGVESGTIAEVLSAGYTLHTRLLKPAMVNIAKKG